MPDCQCLSADSALSLAGHGITDAPLSVTICSSGSLLHQMALVKFEMHIVIFHDGVCVQCVMQ